MHVSMFQVYVAGKYVYVAGKYVYVARYQFFIFQLMRLRGNLVPIISLAIKLQSLKLRAFKLS